MLPELKSERMVLRELVLADGPAMQAFQNNAAQWRYQAVEPAEFADGTLRIQRYLDHRGPDDQRRLMVYVAIDKASAEVIGQVSLSRSHPVIAHIGFGVAEKNFGKGYGTEMARCLLEFGFSRVGLHRVCADVALENKPCIGVLEKLGMQREGVARECIHAQGKWWTEAQYAILESEFVH